MFATATSGPLMISGTAQSAPPAPTACCLSYFDTGSSTLQVEAPNAKLSTTVFGVPSAGPHQFIQYVDPKGGQHLNQPLFADIGGSLAGSQMNSCVDKETGTSVSINATDRFCYVPMTNSGNVTVGLPQASGTTFGCVTNGSIQDQCFYVALSYTGTGTATVNATSSTFYGSGASGSSTQLSSAHRNAKFISDGKNGWLVDRP